LTTTVFFFFLGPGSDRKGGRSNHDAGARDEKDLGQSPPPRATTWWSRPRHWSDSGDRCGYHHILPGHNNNDIDIDRSIDEVKKKDEQRKGVCLCDRVLSLVLGESTHKRTKEDEPPTPWHPPTSPTLSLGRADAGANNSASSSCKIQNRLLPPLT
jgi:hypothetical protein